MHCVDGARSGRLEQVLTRGEEERETLPLADTRKLRNKRINAHAAGTGASELGVNPRPADAVTLRGSRGLPRQLAWPRHLCKWRAPEMLVPRYRPKALDSGALSQSDPDTLSTSPASMRFSGAKLLLREGNA